MDKVNKSCSTRLVEGDGTLNVTELERFIEDVKLAEHGVSYVVVSIMGPRNSGKSTLLNELFGTTFEVMDAQVGISQTTKGIWMAKCADINPCTIILDLEGTDGSERGEDDTAFEKQSALFALAVSDIVLINIWCRDIGRKQAASKPLLRTVFQAMLQMDLFTRRKITLLFVLRDKSKTPLNKIQSKLMKDVHKIWDSVPRSETVKKPELSELFNVEVNGLSNCELPKFEEEVRSLRERIINSIAPGGGDDRRAVFPAAGFSLNVKKLWAAIKENKYLDLPANRVMVASILCQQILEESLSSFVANKDWIKLEEDARSGLVPGFRKRLDSLIHEKCLIDYDKGTAYLEEGVRSEKRKQLEEKMQLHVRSKLMLAHSLSGKLDMFKKEFDNALKEGKLFAAAERDCTNTSIEEFDRECTDIMIRQANSDLAIDKARNKLRCDMDAHITQVRVVKLSELTREYKSKIDEALCKPVKAMLNGCGDHTWPEIRKVLQQVTETDVKGFLHALSAFEIDEKTKEEKCLGLSNYALQVIESTARAEAQPEIVLQRMKLMYMSLFFGKEGVLRAVSMGEDITELTKTRSHELLSSNAAIQLEGGDDDNIWNTLEWALLNNENGGALNSETWKQVPESWTLISPAMCKILWTRFKTHTAVDIDKKVPAEDIDKEVPAEDIDKKVSAEDIDKEVPAEDIHKKVPAVDIDKEVPAEDIDKEVPAEDIDKKVPAEDIDKEVPAEDIHKKVPAEDIHKEVPAEDIHKKYGRFQFQTVAYEKSDVDVLEFPSHIKRREHMEIKDIVKDNVLHFLPAKSLSRFRLVSKEWNEWITNPVLAHKQGHHFKTTSGFFQDDSGSTSFVTLDESAYGVPCPKLRFLPEAVSIRSSCNGLLLCQGQEVFYVCNPVNQECQMLPSPEYYHGNVPKIALVFEPSSLNFEPSYQVICAFSLVEGGRVIFFDIYNSTTKSWKLCDVDVFDLDDSQLEENSFYMNGVVYWETSNGQLLAFDVNNKIYSVLPLPTEITCRGIVSQMDGDLCYIQATYQPENMCRVDIYCGTLMSLKRSFTIDILDETFGHHVETPFQVLPCVSNVVLAILSTRYLYTYNVKDQKVEVKKFLLNAFGAKFFPYVNSLVSVGAI